MIKNLFGNFAIGKWLYGLIAAFIGGGAGAVTSGISAAWIAPDTFNLSKMHNMLLLMGASFVTTGLLNGAAYLHQQPLPAFVVDSNTIQTTQVGSGPKTIVQTQQSATVTPIAGQDPNVKGD